MKTIKHTLILLLVITTITACKNKSEAEVKTIETQTEKELDPNATYAKIEFNIEGMTCAMGCAATIQKKIDAMDGVKYVAVNFDKKLAMVEYDIDKANPDAIKKTIAKVGDIYKVENLRTVDNFSKEE